MSQSLDPKSSLAKSSGFDLERAVRTGDMEAAIRTIKAWRAEGNLGIGMPAHRIIAATGLLKEGNQWHQRLLGRAVELACEPLRNPYHNNRHLLEVTFLAAIMGVQAGLTPDHFAQLLTATLIHDLKHDGTNNKGIPLRLEKIAVDYAEPKLREAGADDAAMDLIRAIVYTTDVSKDFSNAASQSMADQVKAYVSSGGKTKLPGELTLLNHGIYAQLAQIMQDADIGGGLLDYSLSNQTGEYLAQEAGKPYDPKGQVFFFEKICYGRLFSEPGKKLIQPYAQKTMAAFGMSAKDLPLPGLKAA